MTATTGKDCPGCGKDIGVWPIFSAGLPSRIGCPHCKIRLRYRDAAGVIAVVVGLLALVSAAAWFGSGALFPSDTRTRVLAFAGMLLGPWIPIELAIVSFLRSRKQLERVSD